MINLRERIFPTWRGSNSQPPDHQSDAHPTEPPRSANNNCWTGSHKKLWLMGNNQADTWSFYMTSWRRIVSLLRARWGIHYQGRLVFSVKIDWLPSLMSEFFLLRVDPFLERFSCAGKQTGSHKKASLLKKNGDKTYRVYPVPVSVNGR